MVVVSSGASGAAALAGSLAGGLVVAGIGFSTIPPLPPLLRLVGHSLAAALAVGSLGVPLLVGIAGAALAVVFVMWLINLTNFMDGIDGIAGVQTLTVCAAGAVLAQVIAPGTGLWFEPAVLAAASIGFLVWNWPPARVFMGDVGSGYIGFIVAVLTLRAAGLSRTWLVRALLSGVIVDATFTLAQRTARRDRLFEAHRSHAYQHLALAWGHRPVTLLVAAINVCWLTPVAILVALKYLSGPTGLLLAYLPLTAGAIRFGAGTVRGLNPRPC